jgi:hypothetical protein
VKCNNTEKIGYYQQTVKLDDRKEGSVAKSALGLQEINGRGFSG